jgi:flagellar biosynthetic protein FlhB
MAEGDTPDRDQRTEAATPRRLQRARAAGQVPLSRELPAAAGLGAALLAISLAGPSGMHAMTGALAGLLANAHEADLSHAGAAAARAALFGAAPIVLAVLAASVTATLVQTGFLLSATSLVPDLSRVGPLAGLRRLLSPDNAAEAGKSALKLAALGAIVWRSLAGDLDGLAAAPGWDAARLADRVLRAVVAVLLATLAFQAAVAVLDVLWVRIRHAARLRMSREEVRQEQKETEGDPLIKARVRKIRALRARRRMLAAVPKATVVVTNPTHYAVALVYDRAKDAAPRVVAKGVDEMAARIRDAARAHRVPVVSNPPLARALWRVELDAAIPPEHFQAVAEIIAYVWRLARRPGLRA